MSGFPGAPHRCSYRGLDLVARSHIFGLLGTYIAIFLTGLVPRFGTMRISLLLLVKAAVLIAILLWAALAVGADHRRPDPAYRRPQPVGPNADPERAQYSGLVRVALLIGLNAVGIDVPHLQYSAAQSVSGSGSGYRRLSQFRQWHNSACRASDQARPTSSRSADTYGLVASLGGRYTTLRGRDGKETRHPNEMLDRRRSGHGLIQTHLFASIFFFWCGVGSDLRLV